ncbi:hypothetical protein [Methanimicrococcus stummii]|uniref:hypothetical protein n=1 Tax=Methanimicrococcus stummii TaxID=3028294 RepID=UPI00292E3706|nr:hypothetical protein [Methanimicrococcus sp. Es2]
MPPALLSALQFAPALYHHIRSLRERAHGYQPFAPLSVPPRVSRIIFPENKSKYNFVFQKNKLNPSRI